MKINRKIILMTIVAAATVLSFAKAPAAQSDIVDTAVSAKTFTILVKAVQAAELVDALKGKGPFTVFAPSDAAFQKLEKAKPGTLASLLKPEGKELLTKILTYHVLPAKVLKHDVLHLKSGTKVKTLNGQSITVTTRHGVRVDKAKVVKTDILCTNGVIHVIDSVLLPK